MTLQDAAQLSGIVLGMLAVFSIAFRQGMQANKSKKMDARLSAIEEDYLSETKHELLSRVCRSGIYGDMNQYQIELKSDIASLRKDNNDLSGGMRELKEEVKGMRKGMTTINESLIELTTTLRERRPPVES